MVECLVSNQNVAGSSPVFRIKGVLSNWLARKIVNLVPKGHVGSSPTTPIMINKNLRKRIRDRRKKSLMDIDLEGAPDPERRKEYIKAAEESLVEYSKSIKNQ